MIGKIEEFHTALADWFEAEGRDYPWRRTRDPYAILVSELMLQQTQVATVLGPKRYYQNWLQRFPTMEVLAGAGEEEILRAWEGLGYYRRARHLHAAAKMVCDDLGGLFPDTVEGILALPGVGRYTAGAVACFAFGLPAPIVDANVARVLARLYNFRERIDTGRGRATLWSWAEALVPECGARIFNSALMELGQRLCSTKVPACESCPVANFCAGREHDPGALPRKGERRKIERVEEHGIWAEKEGRLLLARGGEGGRREGLWKFPERAAKTVAALPQLLEMGYSITRYRVTLRVYRCPEAVAGPGERWIAREKIEELPMASPYRRALRRIEADALRELKSAPVRV
ncbi:MAG: A/G-specific adenine glycosylase [Verrucomicrobiales bacterium]